MRLSPPPPTQIMSSTWLVAKGNARLVMAVITATLSTVLDSSSAVLNFIVNIVSDCDVRCGPLERFCLYLETPNGSFSCEPRTRHQRRPKTTVDIANPLSC